MRARYADLLHVNQISDECTEDEPTNEGLVGKGKGRRHAHGRRRERHEARDGLLVLCVERILARGEDLGHVE